MDTVILVAIVVMEPPIKLKNFFDLDVWKLGHRVVILIYTETRCFPKEEMFGLVNQMRRSAVSITSNVAEGFGHLSNREKIRYYTIAIGSATELQNQIRISHDVQYLPYESFTALNEFLISIQKMLSRLVAVIRQKEL